MFGINQFIIDGNLTANVVLDRTTQGTPMARYVVAVDNHPSKAGRQRAAANLIPITTFGRQADNDARFLRKGSAVTVIGEIESWSRPEQRTRGFNFVGQTVVYRDRSNLADAGALPDEAGAITAQWLQEFDGQRLDDDASPT